jgi:hypothetical protein
MTAFPDLRSIPACGTNKRGTAGEGWACVSAGTELYRKSVTGARPLVSARGLLHTSESAKPEPFPRRPWFDIIAHPAHCPVAETNALPLVYAAALIRSFPSLSLPLRHPLLPHFNE